MGAKGLPIRTDVPAAELRQLARREQNRAAAARMQAIASALGGEPRRVVRRQSVLSLHARAHLISMQVAALLQPG